MKDRDLNPKHEQAVPNHKQVFGAVEFPIQK
jgi:hypothetical protein